MIVTQTEEQAVQGPDYIVDGWILTCTFTKEEMDVLLASYDPASSTSPSVTGCRPIVREMLNAVLAYQPQADSP